MTLLRKDIRSAKDLKLQLEHDRHSSTLTEELGRGADELENAYKTLNALVLNRDNNKDTILAILRDAQKTVKSLQPLCARASSMAASLRPKKKAKGKDDGASTVGGDAEGELHD